MLLSTARNSSDFAEIEIGVGKLAENEIKSLNPHEGGGNDSAIDGRISVNSIFGLVMRQIGIEADQL